MVSPVHPDDWVCTPVTPRCTPVENWTLAGAVRKGVTDTNMFSIVFMICKSTVVDKLLIF